MARDKDLPPPPDLTGRQIGSLTVRDRIAVGGFGVVFKAFDDKLGVFRAVKIIHSHHAQGPKLRQLFEQEMRTLAQLDDPNIVRILYPIEEPDLLGYVMEYVPGGTLRRMLKEKKRLGLHQAIDIAIQIGAAVNHAHTLATPVIHRDLTPENVIVRPDGVVKLTDFGIAKKVDDSSWLYTPGVTGKPRYMSPEIFEGIITASCDIYALGIILYELIAGRTPFEAGSSVGYYKLHREQMVEPPSRAVPDLPWKLERVILRMLAKRMSNRYERMEEVLEQLRLLQALIRTGAFSLFTQSERDMQAGHQAAHAAFVAGRFDESSAALKQILDIDPESVLAKEGIELCSRKTAEPAQLGAGELEVSTTMRRGLLYFVKGRFREAKEHFDRVLERDPGHEEAKSFQDQAALRLQPGSDSASPDRTAEEYFQEGCKYLHDRNYSMSVVFFDLALEVDPTHDGAKDSREIAELRQRELRTEARRLSEKKRKSDTLLAEGLKLYASNAFSLARDKFKEVLAVDPMNTEARKHRVLSDEKLFEMERALKKEQGESTADLLREGQECLTRKDFARAVACFERVVDARKDDAEAARLLAQARTAQDKRETEISFHRKKGFELFEAGEYEEALPFLTKLRGLTPDEPESAEKAAQAEARIESRRRSRDLSQRLQSVLQLFGQGLYREALQAAEEILALEPKNADAAEYKRRCEANIAAQERAIAAGEASRAIAGVEPAPAGAVTAKPPAAGLPDLPHGHSPTLISRMREANRLERALDEASQGKGAFVVVTGDTGMGKSRLVREMLVQNSFRSTLFLTAECPKDLGATHAVLKDLAAQAFARLESAAPEISVKLMMKWGPEMSKLIPGLRDKLYALELSPIMDLSAARIQELLRDFWLDLVKARPVALVFERLEWLDRSSCEILQSLLPRLRDLPFLIVGTLSPEKRLENHPFPRWMADLRRERTAVEITVGPFSTLDVEVFLRSALHWDRPDATLVRDIFTLSGGNPAKVERMVGFLLDHQILTKDGSQWMVASRASESLDLALGMTQELVRKLDSVQKKHIAVLQALSVFPRPIGFKVISQVTGTAETQLYYLVNDLVSERMVIEQPDKSATAFRIITEKFREHIYGAISADERAKLHERAAHGMEGLLAELGEDAYPEIAAQYLQTAQADKIVEFCLKAADRSLARGMNGEAMTHLDKAAEYQNRVKNKDAPVDLLERMGLAGVRMGQGDPAVRKLQQAATGAAKRPERLIAIQRHLATAALRHDRLTDASRAVEAAFNQLGRKEKTTDVDVHLLLARSALAREDLTRAEELVGQLLERAKAAGRRDAAAEGQIVRAHAAFLTGRWDECLKLAQEALAALDKLDARLPASEARLLIARVHTLRGKKAEAREPLEAALTAGRAMPDPWIEAGALLGYAESAWRQGEPTPARDWIKRALRLCELNDAPRLLARGNLLLAEVEMVLGETDAARDRAMDSFIRFERLGLREGMAQASRLQAEINLRSGASERALADARRAMELVEKGGYVSLYALAAAAMGEALAERGQAADAEPLIAAARDTAKRLQDPGAEARATRALGALFKAKRNSAQAATTYHEALKQYEKIGDRMACADGRLAYAAFLLDAGANAAARNVAGKNLKVARAAFHDVGARAVLTRIEGLMERCKEGGEEKG